MEMKLEQSKFWLLEQGSDNWIYDSKKDAVSNVGKLIDDGADPDEITLTAVDVGSDELELKTVPWKEITQGIVRG